MVLRISNLEEPPYTTTICLSKAEAALIPDPLKSRINDWVNVRLKELEEYCPSLALMPREFNDSGNHGNLWVCRLAGKHWRSGG